MVFLQDSDDVFERRQEIARNIRQRKMNSAQKRTGTGVPVHVQVIATFDM